VGAIYDLRIYVAVTSPYLWDRGVTDRLNHNLLWSKNFTCYSHS